MSRQTWARGDRVVHALKPEWGHGEVLTVQPTQHDGKPCQKLTIRFDRAGTKTLTTAIADLRPAGAGSAKPESPIDAGATRIDAPMEARLMPDALVLAATADEAAERLRTLPEDATDPFRPLAARLRATLALYRFTETGASLLDWAAAQTGLVDPLSRFNRHELERAFQDFRIVTENHLRKLTREMSRQDSSGLAAVVAEQPPAALQALRRVGAVR
ncbi:MAG: hypothetical protein HBSAPP03_20850 [Phycisphaerae bacterium]|nr:MAG: hypothetical protein HBSAPP03_20850 [Phycisphaerae bacterium]